MLYFYWKKIASTLFILTMTISPMRASRQVEDNLVNHSHFKNSIIPNRIKRPLPFDLELGNGHHSKKVKFDSIVHRSNPGQSNISYPQVIEIDDNESNKPNQASTNPSAPVQHAHNDLESDIIWSTFDASKNVNLSSNNDWRRFSAKLPLKLNGYRSREDFSSEPPSTIGVFYMFEPISGHSNQYQNTTRETFKKSIPVQPAQHSSYPQDMSSNRSKNFTIQGMLNPAEASHDHKQINPHLNLPPISTFNFYPSQPWISQKIITSSNHNSISDNPPDLFLADKPANIITPSAKPIPSAEVKIVELNPKESPKPSTFSSYDPFSQQNSSNSGLRDALRKTENEFKEKVRSILNILNSIKTLEGYDKKALLPFFEKLDLGKLTDKELNQKLSRKFQKFNENKLSNEQFILEIFELYQCQLITHYIDAYPHFGFRAMANQIGEEDQVRSRKSWETAIRLFYGNNNLKSNNAINWGKVFEVWFRRHPDEKNRKQLIRTIWAIGSGTKSSKRKLEGLLNAINRVGWTDKYIIRKINNRMSKLH